jgi:sortase A
MKLRHAAEYVLLLGGLLGLDYFVWVNAGSSVSQAYESWSFEQDLRGKPSTLAGFLDNRWHLLLAKPMEARVEPITPVPGTTAPAPVWRPVAQSVLGRVKIPRLNMSVMVREGVDTATLLRAVGHIPSTALPGQSGNIALAGHRDTYFRPLEHIQSGDHIQLETRDGNYEYVVESTEVVSPKDVWVLKAANHPTLTLITCFPFHYFGSAPNRFIVRAVRVNVEASMPLNSRAQSGS